MIVVPTSFAIGDALRHERATQGLSQGELAARAGVSRQWLSQVENGKRTAEIDKVLGVVAALGLTLALVKVPATPTRRRVDAVLAECGLG